MKSLFLTYVLLFTSTLFAQKIEYATLLIPDSLKQNANAVVRLHQIDIDIASQRKMTINEKRIVTVLNEKGQNAIDAIENYNKRTNINSIEATIYNAFGKEIKRIKQKDFRDQCATDGGTVFSDSRYLYLDYTPTEYPFTIVYESEIETSTTAFIPKWFPLTDYYVSVEKSILNVKYPENLGFKKKEFNFSDYRIQKTIDTSTQLSYTTNVILAQKREEGSPSLSKLLPNVMMALELFNLEGVDGTAKTWKEFGKWFSEEIVGTTGEISNETKSKIKALVGTETDPIKKAKIVYKYVQEKSRYVSIQEGIGGWRPMLAKDVDRLGYGDCKALSNYTKALLNAVDVTAYYTKLYGDETKTDIFSDFVCQQGNHVILAIPSGNDYTFLECTSQVDPFGYQGTFTDDRLVLILKPEGGEIVRTKVYPDEGNTQTSKGNYIISETGDFSGTISIVSEGSQYSEKYGLETEQPVDQEKYYKEYWDNIGNLKINKITFANDKDKISFTENLSVSATNYGKFSGNSFIFAVNAFNQFTDIIKKIRNRKTPFEIQRGFLDIDEIAIALPQGFVIEALPQNFELNSKFGTYKTEIIKKDDGSLIYKRSFFLKKALYNKNEYDEYRLFMEQVSRNDNAKMILTKK